MMIPERAERRPTLQWPRAATLVRGLVLSSGLVLGLGPSPAPAHDFKAGALVIDHPCATPTPPGARTGAVHFRALRNPGREADRLLGASTAAAASVAIHRTTMDGDVMRMRQLEALELPPGAEPKVRHGGEVHLMLVDLEAPLKDGDRFPIRLGFERAGEREVTVMVQRLRGGGAASEHKH